MAERTRPLSERLAVDRPQRGADRNEPLVDGADTATESRLFPTLEPGLTLLDIEGGRGVAVLQSLVLDHLLGADGPALWVDSDGHATTTTMARIAPSQRLLDRVHVARGFTASQHYGVVCALPDTVDQCVREATRGRRDGDGTPSLVVAPAVDARYRREDGLSDRQAATLQARTLARLQAYAEGYDVPVVLTRTATDGFTAAVERAADHRIECEQTRMGPRFVGETFETLVYPVGDGAYYQTTLAYWREVLAARARGVGVEPSTDAAGGSSPSDLGGPTADPLADAWTAGGR